MRRTVTTRKTTLAQLDDRFDADFWATVPPAERLAETWRLTLELGRFAGRDPGEPGLHRSIARVVRR
jgi:hypothetical protein